MLIIDWKNFHTKKNILSIRKEIQENSKKFKNDYIELINLITKIKYKKQNVLDISKLYKNFNLWESGIIEEKSFYNSSEFNDTIYIFALRNILKKKKFKKIKIINFDLEKKYLLDAIKDKNLNIIIEYDKINNYKHQQIIKKIYKFLPLFLQSLLQIFYMLRFLFIRSKAKKNINYKELNDFFFSTTYYLKSNENKNDLGENLIGNIPKNYSKIKNKIFITNFHQSEKSIFEENKNFNLSSNRVNSYILVNSLFEFKHFFLILFYYMKIYFSFNLFKLKKKIFSNRKLNYLSSVFNDSWNKTFYGPVAVKNIFLILVIDDFLSKFKKLNKSFIIYENQGWDKIFRTSWRNHKGGRVYGIINSAIRYWDMRYFLTKKNLIYPDVILINKLFYTNNYFHSIKKILIKNIFQKTSIKNTLKKLKYKKNAIIIYGDIVDKTNFHFLDEIHQKYQTFKKFTFYYKPHPASKLDIKIFNRLNLKILKSENKKKFLFKKSISLGATSSVLEIKSSKNDLAVYVPPSSLDFSPTFKIKKFKKIYSSLDLLKFLND